MSQRNTTLAFLYFASIVIALPAVAQPCIAIDGDTLRCGAERVRLRAIYAPELAEPCGIAARQRLSDLLASGELVIKRRGQDRYRRTLATIYIDGRRVEQADIGFRGGRGYRPTTDAER